MKDPNQKKYRDWYKKEFGLAQTILHSRGGVLEWSNHCYEAFTYRELDRVRLVFYPHKTSAGNYHLRVRDQGSTNQVLADEIMDALDMLTGYNCTFTRKSGHPIKGGKYEKTGS